MAWCIYKHTNKINGKVYIGQTKHDKNPNLRWVNGAGYSPLFPFGRAIDKYGWHNFEHEIIEKDIETLEEANARETYWISQYHSYVGDPQCNGYNATKGGDNRENLGKTIYQLDANSFFIIRKWNSILEAAEEFSTDHRVIQRACTGEYRHAVGYCWCFVEDYCEGWQVRVDNDKQAVVCLETNQQYESVNEASRQTGICAGSIAGVCRGKQKTAGGYTWKYVYHHIDNWEVTPTYNSNCRAVLCYEDKTSFNSVADASRYYGLDSSAITKCCRGKLKTTGGKHFYYEGEEPNLEQATYGAKPCECVDTGEWFSSSSEAARRSGIGVTSIAKTCSGKQKTAGGLRWRYLNDEEKAFYFKNYIVDYNAASKKNKMVCCIELNRTFATAAIAGAELSISCDLIRKNCTGSISNAGGYHWEYVD